MRNITDFGAFVEVEEGVDGLVHISDLPGLGASEPRRSLEEGTTWAVILKIDSDNQRLSLGIKQLQPNVLEDFFKSHGVGDVLTGKIVRLTEFGAFVELFEGIEGLVHVSEMSQDRIENPQEHFAVDQEVRVKIIKMDSVEKKIGLSIKAAVGEPDDSSLHAYQLSQQGDGSATLGDVVGEDVLRRGDSDED